MLLIGIEENGGRIEEVQGKMEVKKMFYVPWMESEDAEDKREKYKEAKLIVTIVNMVIFECLYEELHDKFKKK